MPGLRDAALELVEPEAVDRAERAAAAQPAAAARIAPQASIAPVKSYGLAPSRRTVASARAGGVGGDRDDARARPRARRGVRPAGRALARAGPPPRRSRRARRARFVASAVARRHRLQRPRRRAEPAQPDADVAQAGVHARQRELLGRADRDRGARRRSERTCARRALASRAGRRETRRPARRASRPPTRACRRWTARAVAADEVADVDAHRALAGLAQRERAREVAGHVVVAERRQQADAGRLGGARRGARRPRG